MEDASYGGSGASKRDRDEPEEAPEAKRIRAADLILLDMLDDAEPADGDLASVMRSLEEEIAPFSSPQADRRQPQEDGGLSTSAEDLRESDLGYLLEASDDELGLPPTVPSSSEEGDGAEGETGEVGTQGPEGIGQIWGLEEEIRSCYDALEFGEFGHVAGGDGDVDGGLVFDGGLFDYADAASLAEFSWQAESLPAV